MTQEEYDHTDFVGKYFTGNFKVRYNGRVYDVVGWDDEERLIAICETTDREDVSYKRCENCELL